MAEREVIREFLSSLGFVVNEPSYRNFIGKLRSSKGEALKVGGAILGIGVATDIMAAKMARGMEKVYYQSLRTRSTVSNLKALEFGFGQVGLTAEMSAETVESFAAQVRNQPGLTALLRKFGVGGGDSTQQLIGLIRELKKMGPQGSVGYAIAAQFAEQFGISEKVFQTLTLPGALEKLEEAGQRQRQMYRDMGVDQDVAAEASRDFMNKLRDLGMQFGVLRESFLIQLMPTFNSIHTMVSDLMTDLSKIDFKSLDFEFKYLKGFVDEQTKSWGAWGLVMTPIAAVISTIANMPERFGKMKDLNDEALGRAYANTFGGPNWREGGRRSPLFPTNPNYGPKDITGPQLDAMDQRERAGRGYVPGLHSDKRRLSPAEQLEVLRNELLDPERNPEFGAQLREEIQRLERSTGPLSSRSNGRDALAASGGLTINFTAETTVAVSGSGDPRETARAVGAEQGNVTRRYGDIVRNLAGAVG